MVYTVYVKNFIQDEMNKWRIKKTCIRLGNFIWRVQVIWRILSPDWRISWRLLDGLVKRRRDVGGVPHIVELISSNDIFSELQSSQLLHWAKHRANVSVNLEAELEALQWYLYQS
jgi:hypothetical protein